MKGQIFIVTAFFLLTIKSFSQKTKKLLKIYDFGLTAGHRNDSCAKATDKKYGFLLVSAGCIPKKRLRRKNQKRLILLDKQNGIEWREKYKKELKKCDRPDSFPQIPFFEIDWDI